MSKAFGIGFALAVLVIIVLVWRGFEETKGNHLVPTGFISNVRVQAIQEEETLMIIDFRLINDADVTMTAAKIDPWITTHGGQDIHGSLFASADMPQTFRFYPSLGPILHPPLLLRGDIAGHQSKDFMVGVEFDVPARVIEGRKAVTLHIEDPTGPFVELTSK